MNHYKEAQKLDPDNLDTILNIADMHEKLEEYLDAYNTYRTVTNLQPGHAKAQEGIGRVRRVLDEKGIHYDTQQKA